MSKDAIRCKDCGRYISYVALSRSHHHFVPLNEFGPEESYWVCPKCKDHPSR